MPVYTSRWKCSPSFGRPVIMARAVARADGVLFAEMCSGQAGMSLESYDSG